MSVTYAGVQWNRHKRIYDALLAGGVVLYLGVFCAAGSLAYRGVHAISPPILLMRALGTCAYLMLHFVLCIGPLARLDRRWLPLLYNRRHFGVATFVVGLLHALLVLGFYHGFGRLNPLVSLLTGNTNYGSLTAFPFEMLGLAALLILFVMAATSHDFWLRNLGARVWKSLHMLVYAAYALLAGHVSLGALQTHRSPWLSGLVLAGAGVVGILHVVAGQREHRRERRAVPAGDGWIDAGAARDMGDGRGRVVCTPRGERIAVFRHGDQLSAVTNVCAHQGGPLGEGRIIDGCITCPWHGWQYRPADGRSPPPFTERIATHRVQVVDGRVRVDSQPLPPGTPVEAPIIAGEPDVR